MRAGECISSRSRRNKMLMNRKKSGEYVPELVRVWALKSPVFAGFRAGFPHKNWIPAPAPAPAPASPVFAGIWGAGRPIFRRAGFPGDILKIHSHAYGHPLRPSPHSSLVRMSPGKPVRRNMGIPAPQILANTGDAGAGAGAGIRFLCGKPARKPTKYRHLKRPYPHLFRHIPTHLSPIYLHFISPKS